MTTYEGDVLVVPDDMLELVDSSGELRRLVDCFRIVNPEQLTRSFKTSEWTTSTFNGVDPFITVSTAVGAGGTGKTTVSSTLAYDRVLQHKTSALVINADAQASLEQRTLSKLIYRLYHDDWGLFLELNGLQPFLNSTQLGVPTNLKDSLLTLFRLGGEYNNRIWPPKVVSVDLTRLQSSGYADTSNTARLYVVLTDEDMADWDQKLIESKLQMPGLGMSVQKASFGAFWALAKISAYVFNTPYIFVDLGPGNGWFNRTVVCSAHGVILPLIIESKADMTIKSFSLKMPKWWADWGQIRVTANTPDNPYHVPGHVPKLFGVVFSRLGARGAVRPMNEYQQLMRCYQRITDTLLPMARDQRMALDNNLYDQKVQQIMGVLHNANVQALAGVPQPCRGVVGLLRDYDALQHMSERECVPVPFLRAHHFRTMSAAAIDYQGPNMPENAYLVPAGNQPLLALKVQNINDMCQVFTQVIDYERDRLIVLQQQQQQRQEQRQEQHQEQHQEQQGAAAP